MFKGIRGKRRSERLWGNFFFWFGERGRRGGTFFFFDILAVTTYNTISHDDFLTLFLFFIWDILPPFFYFLTYIPFFLLISVRLSFPAPPLYASFIFFFA
jgi:hypothetical protein